MRMRSERGKGSCACSLVSHSRQRGVFNMDVLQESVMATCTPARRFKAVLVNFKKMRTAPDTPTNSGGGALIAGVRASAFSGVM